MSFLQEFEAFAMCGSVVDLSVVVPIGDVPEPVKLTEEVQLLTDIRDLIKDKQASQ